jgi:hypothetical protein
MKTIPSVLFLAAALASSGLSQAGAERPARAAVEHAVSVKQVTGVAEYAYDSTGWRPLVIGKILHAGASIRTLGESTVILSMEEHGSLIRVGPSKRLELSKAAPHHEAGIAIVPARTRTNVEVVERLAFED